MAILFGKQYKEIDMTDIGEAASRKRQCHDQPLVDLYINMPAIYREMWLTRPVISVIEEDYKNRKATPPAKEPLFVRIEFNGGPALQYPSRNDVLDIASALQECSDWKPSKALQEYLDEHRKVKNIHLGVCITPEKASFEDLAYIKPPQAGLKINDDGSIKVLTSNETAQMLKNRCLDLLSTPPGMNVKETDIEYRHYDILNSTYAAIYGTDTSNHTPTRFTDAPFKVIRDYLYACSFLSPFANGFVDYANDLLAYRLSYAISQEKDIPAREAIGNLARELNDFANNHADNAWGLRASAKIELFGGTELPALTVRSDFGIITVDYEPTLTTLDWENRYAQLRTRHG